MSIDFLHERIRKLKNPSVIDFGIKPDVVPPHILEQASNATQAYGTFCRELLESLKDLVPAVRFSFGTFALMGAEGMELLESLLHEAGELGYYVLLDTPEILSPWEADRTAETILSGDRFHCDGVVMFPYIGSDSVKPFAPLCKERGKDLFAIVRSPNRSASEIQDLLTGSRLVHSAAAAIVDRFGDSAIGKCGYSCIGSGVSAAAPESIKMLRSQYKRMFLLVDGLDYPGGNAKNCSYAFDRLGYGAVVCAGPSVTAAWKEAGTDGQDYVQQAVQAAERMKRNLTRYIDIL